MTVPFTALAQPGVPVITSAQSVDTGWAGGGYAPVNYYYTITATNTPTRFAVGGLPSSSQIDSATGTFNLSPTGPAVYNLTVSATNSAGTGSANVRIAVHQSPFGGSALVKSGTYGIGAVIRLGVTFGSPVIVTGNPTLSAGAIFEYESGSGTSTLTFRHVVTASDDSTVPNDDWSLGFNAGSIADTTLGLPVLSRVPGPGYEAWEIGFAGKSGPAARLINLSAKAYCNTGADALAAGFVIAGDASKTKPVFVRGVGPTLVEFGVANPVAEAALTLYRSGAEVVASNDGWGTDSLLASTGSSVGAFALPNNSGDSAIVWALYPGAYTIQVTDDTGTGGSALAEIYDANLGDTSTRLINISARAKVGSYPTASLASGFVISGSGTETILIRGIGPALAAFGVSSPASVPTLMLFDSKSSLIAQNTGWPAAAEVNGSAVSLSDVFAQVGAFALPSGSADCAILVSLPSGAYTAHLAQGAGSTEAVGLVEIYEVPQ